MFQTISDILLDGVASVLAFFYSLPVVGGSYGIAIIFLTLSIMVLLMPLTLKATRSTIKMTQMQPKLKAIQKKYKNDRAAMNVEVMALYKKHKISPVGGCLPMIAQLPVFLILFNVIRGITRRVSDLPYYNIANSAWDKAGASVDSETFSPDHLDSSTLLFKDLTQATAMKFGPLDLGNRTWDVIQSEFFGGLPYVFLILFVVGSSFYQQRQVQARRGNKPSAINPQQQMIMRFLPILSGVWGFIFPAGLVLYWATSNSFRIGQQAYITRKMFGEGSSSDLSEDDDVDEEEIEESEIIDVDQSPIDRSGREEAWAKRRKEKAKAKSSHTASKNSSNSSSRTTPKGTAPNKKKNRKR